MIKKKMKVEIKKYEIIKEKILTKIYINSKNFFI